MNLRRRRDFQQEGLLALSRQGQPQFTDTWVPYTSGQIGPYYIESTAIEANGSAYRKAINHMCELIDGTIGINGFDVISGGETRDWDFSHPIAVVLGKPHAKLYKNGKRLGADVKNARVLHVADLNNQGSSMRNMWKPYVDNAGGKIVHAVFYVDRCEDGVQVMEDIGIAYDSAVPFDAHAWNFLRKMNITSEPVHTSLMARMEDKTAWAHNALRTHIEPLEAMLQSDDPTKVAKGEKILTHGYPELKDELLALMKERGYEHRFGGEQ
ncbi:hypothetical protein CL620_05490 [archaeon]|nr:hypothetical protein [archaeon]